MKKALDIQKKVLSFTFQAKEQQEHILIEQCYVYCLMARRKSSTLGNTMAKAGGGIIEKGSL